MNYLKKSTTILRHIPFRRGQTHQYMGILFSAGSGFILGYAISDQLFNDSKNVDWFWGGVAIGMLIPSIVLDLRSASEINEAIDIYNADLGATRMYHSGPRGYPSLAVSGRIVYGDYKMEYMRDLQRNLSDQMQSIYELPFTRTDDFPAYFGYELSFNGNFTKWSLGTKMGFRTTAGQVYYRDQTGEINVSSQLQLIEITEYVGIPFVKKNKWIAEFGLNFGLGRNKELYKVKFDLVDGALESGSVSYNSMNFILGPEWRNYFYVKDKLFLELITAYDYHGFEAKQSANNSLRSIFEFHRGWDNPDWSGWRIGVGIGIMM